MFTKNEKFIEILNKEFEVIYDGKIKGKTCGYTKKYEDGYAHYYIKVKFDNAGEEQNFYFPDSFYIHLRAIDKNIQDAILGKTIFIPERPKRRIEFYYLCGTDSKRIYLEMCNIFGWDMSKKGHFGMRTLMYSENCTPENYSVWFIPHNNLCEPFSEAFNWFNIVSGDKIEEIWLGQINRSLHNDWSDRVTFVKTKDGNGYRFYGIYRPQEIVEKEIHHKTRTVKIYKQISTRYSNY